MAAPQWARKSIGYKDDSKIGVRVNWLNFVCAVLLAIAVWVGTKLADANKDLFTGWSFGGIVILAFLALVIGGLGVLAKKSDDSWPVYAAFLLGIVATIVATILVFVFNASWYSVVFGFLGFVLVGGLIAIISITRWWRPFNRDNV